MRLSLLLLLLRLACGGTECALFVMSHVCPGPGTAGGAWSGQLTSKQHNKKKCCLNRKQKRLTPGGEGGGGQQRIRPKISGHLH